MDAPTVCYSCGRRYGPERTHCDCGEPVWFETDTEGFDWPATREQGMWPYADLLPAGVPADLSIAAGGTPLVRAARLDDYAGCRLYLKDETENPTGTFKDRGSAVAVTAIRERGGEWIGTVSHGNMAMSTAAHAAAAGLNCAVFVPDDIAPARLAAIAQYDPEIVRVRGDYGKLYRETLAADSAVAFVNSDTPLRVAGQKTVAYEICERLDADAIALPVSSGGQASAVWQALRELHAADLLDELPRIYLAQAAACDPIARAYHEGADAVTPVEGGETIAYSIANADPPSGSRALAAVRETGGAVVAVPDDEIRAAQARLAGKGGLCVEPASATVLAGLRRLADRGAVAPGDEVAMIATGTGFRELDATGGDRGRVVDVADLRTTLAELADDYRG